MTNETDKRISHITGTLLDLDDKDTDGKVEEINRIRESIINGVMAHGDILDDKIHTQLRGYLKDMSGDLFRGVALKQEDDNAKRNQLIQYAMVQLQREGGGSADLPEPPPEERRSEFLDLGLTSKDIDVPEGVLIIGDDISTTVDNRTKGV